MTRPVSHTAYRAAMSRFASGVTVVSTVADGVDHAMTANAFTAVSLEPPLVLVCVERTTRFHEAIRRSDLWAASLLDDQAEQVSAWFATKGRPLDGQVEKFPYRRGPITGAALFESALAWVECRTWQSYAGGDHTIVVGEVVGAAVADTAAGPLLHYRSSYPTLAEDPDR